MVVGVGDGVMVGVWFEDVRFDWNDGDFEGEIIFIEWIGKQMLVIIEGLQGEVRVMFLVDNFY